MAGGVVSEKERGLDGMDLRCTVFFAGSGSVGGG